MKKLILSEGAVATRTMPIVKFWVIYDGTQIVFDVDTATNAYRRIQDILSQNPSFAKEYDLLDIGMIELEIDKMGNVEETDFLLWCNPAEEDLEEVEDGKDYLDTIIDGNWDWAVEDLKNLLR